MSEEAVSAVDLTADIVAAHVSNNSVAVGDIPALIASVHAALAGLRGATQEAAPAPRDPAVSIRSSVKPDAITCLICGSKNKMLKRHLQTAHQLTPAEYRSEFGLKPDYPLVASDHSERRAAIAKSIGLGTKGNRSGGKRSTVKA